MNDTRHRQKRHKLAVLVNMIAPYRAPLYSRFGECFNTLVLTSGKEVGVQWDEVRGTSRFRVESVWGIRFKFRRTGTRGHLFDYGYFHLSPGYFWSLMRFRPDVVISSEMGLRTLIALLYGRLARIPVLVWWGGTRHTERGRSGFKRLLRRLIFVRLVRTWISYGITSTEYLSSIGVSSDCILQIQNTVDERLFTQPIDSLHLDCPHPIVLIVGRLAERKGLYQLLDVASMAQVRGERFSLVFVGEGEESEALSDKARRLGLRHVYWLDRVPAEQMASVYRAADFLLFPTLEDVWGLVVNEALLSGTPVLASRYAGCAEELLPDCNVFDPQDQQGFLIAFIGALHGCLCPPDLERLRSSDEVANLIIEDVRSRLKRAGA